MNLKEYLADGPKKMFSILEGIVKVHLLGLNTEPYISGCNGINYNIDGTEETVESKYRVLFSIEEAESLGFVKRVVDERCRVKYRDKDDGQVRISAAMFKNRADFEECFNEFFFISFVDNDLNECPPPSVEWVETMPDWMRVKAQ